MAAKQCQVVIIIFNIVVVVVIVSNVESESERQ